MKLSRRKFIESSAATAALAMVPDYSWKNTVIEGSPLISAQDSNFGGVQVGAITYSWRSMPGGIENIINYCRQSGVNSIELMSGDLEKYLGIPVNPVTTNTGQRNQRTPEQEAAIAKYKQDLKDWRVSLKTSQIEQARKLFDKAGIKIHIVKFSPAQWSDEEINYAFRTARIMGAKGVSEEIGDAVVQKLAPFAEKHGMYAVFHNHMQFATPGFSYDPFLAVSPAVMMNFDAGHFFGSTGIHPNTIIEKYHDRIFSVHLKDKTGPGTQPANMNQVWGQGEVPLADVLLLIKKQKWPIYCDIELEYEIKPWSNAVKETKTCVEYARQILI